jgi:hypothetical protein
VLKISGVPYLAMASFNASRQKSVSIVIEVARALARR